MRADFDENCWVEIGLKGKDKLLVGCIYRSPNSDIINDVKVLSSLKKICSRKEYSHLLICGDFNFPDINWIEDLTPENQQSPGFHFRECIRDCYLSQHVKEPTHRRAEQTPSTLDLVFTNEENMVEGLTVEAPLGKSHHAVLVFTYVCYTKPKSHDFPKPLYSKGNYDKFAIWLKSFDWDKDFEGRDCEYCWKLFANRMAEGIRKFIPHKTANYGKPGRPLWMNALALEKVRKKTEAYKRYLNTREGRDFQQYARARNQARWESRKAKRSFEKQLARESKSNPKAFYNYVNGKLKTRAGVANLETKDGKATCDQTKAEVLNNFFTSVFTREMLSNIPILDMLDKINTPLEKILITDELVKKKLDKLKPTKSPGPDGMHPRILKELSHVISGPLATIMSKSLQEGIVPSPWKTAHVSPIYKKGPKSDPGNYRPVSLTSVVCKTLEGIIRDHVMEFINVNNLLSTCQHGFVSGRSCSTQLLQCLDIWTELLHCSRKVT